MNPKDVLSVPVIAHELMEGSIPMTFPIDIQLQPRPTYETSVSATRDERMRWWRQSRYGMFIHYGLYSLMGRCEQVQIHECVPAAEYEALPQQFRPKPNCAREWAALARRAGMRYAVLTTKHHDGFCLWDTTQTAYNSMQSCGRDLVREFVEACHAEGLRVGFYYSLLDIHHPDGARGTYDSTARRRFIDFTHACVHELMTRYGRIDCLWYDVPEPFKTPEGWESVAMNQMVRFLQPDIIINNRSRLPEDHDTPEGSVLHKAPRGRDWEACMTLNGSWGALPGADRDTATPRDIVRMLGIVSAGPGNLLLNIGPTPDGSVPPASVASLEAVGCWLKTNGIAAFGDLSPGCGVWHVCSTGVLSIKGSKAYFWCHWNGKEQGFGGFSTRLCAARVLNGPNIAFRQEGYHIRLINCPEQSPDPIAGVTIIEMEFEAPPVFSFRPLLPHIHI